MTDKPIINIQNQIEQPRSRQEYYIMHKRAVIDAINKGNQSMIINSILNCLSVALPEIPSDKYDHDRPYSLKPKYADVRKEYLDSHPMTVQEIETAHYNIIDSWTKEKYIHALLKELNIIETLLKQYTNWNFGEMIGKTYGK